MLRISIFFCSMISSLAAMSAGLPQASAEMNRDAASRMAGDSTQPNNSHYAAFADKPSVTTGDPSVNSIETRYKAALDRLPQQAASIEAYAKANNYNAEYFFLVDMSIPSGKNRFFVYNIKKGAVEYASLVSHGWGSYLPDCNDVLEFSNRPNSFKTSLGKYKIGKSYTGTFGLSYKLYGLDSTNDKAFERTIVLHGDSHVPDTEPFPYHIFESAGCPTVSTSFLAVLGRYIKASPKPVLLWIYN